MIVCIVFFFKNCILINILERVEARSIDILPHLQSFVDHIAWLKRVHTEQCIVAWNICMNK